MGTTRALQLICIIVAVSRVKECHGDVPDQEDFPDDNSIAEWETEAGSSEDGRFDVLQFSPSRFIRNRRPLARRVSKKKNRMEATEESVNAIGGTRFDRPNQETRPNGEDSSLSTKPDYISEAALHQVDTQGPFEMPVASVKCQPEYDISETPVSEVQILRDSQGPDHTMQTQSPSIWQIPSPSDLFQGGQHSEAEDQDGNPEVHDSSPNYAYSTGSERFNIVPSVKEQAFQGSPGQSRKQTNTDFSADNEVNAQKTEGRVLPISVNAENENQFFSQTQEDETDFEEDDDEEEDPPMNFPFPSLYSLFLWGEFGAAQTFSSDAQQPRPLQRNPNAGSKKTTQNAYSDLGSQVNVVENVLPHASTSPLDKNKKTIEEVEIRPVVSSAGLYGGSDETVDKEMQQSCPISEPLLETFANVKPPTSELVFEQTSSETKSPNSLVDGTASLLKREEATETSVNIEQLILATSNSLGQEVEINRKPVRKRQKPLKTAKNTWLSAQRAKRKKAKVIDEFSDTETSTSLKGSEDPMALNETPFSTIDSLREANVSDGAVRQNIKDSSAEADNQQKGQQFQPVSPSNPNTSGILQSFVDFTSTLQQLTSTVQHFPKGNKVEELTAATADSENATNISSHPVGYSTEASLNYPVYSIVVPEKQVLVSQNGISNISAVQFSKVFAVNQESQTLAPLASQGPTASALSSVTSEDQTNQTPLPKQHRPSSGQVVAQQHQTLASYSPLYVKQQNARTNGEDPTIEFENEIASKLPSPTHPEPLIPESLSHAAEMFVYQLQNERMPPAAQNVIDGEEFQYVLPTTFTSGPKLLNISSQSHLPKINTESRRKKKKSGGAKQVFYPPKKQKQGSIASDNASQNFTSVSYEPTKNSNTKKQQTNQSSKENSARPEKAPFGHQGQKPSKGQQTEQGISGNDPHSISETKYRPNKKQLDNAVKKPTQHPQSQNLAFPSDISFQNPDEDPANLKKPFQNSDISFQDPANLKKPQRISTIATKEPPKWQLGHAQQGSENHNQHNTHPPLQPGRFQQPHSSTAEKGATSSNGHSQSQAAQEFSSQMTSHQKYMSANPRRPENFQHHHLGQMPIKPDGGSAQMVQIEEGFKMPPVHMGAFQHPQTPSEETSEQRPTGLFANLLQSILSDNFQMSQGSPANKETSQMQENYDHTNEYQNLPAMYLEETNRPHIYSAEKPQSSKPNKYQEAHHSNPQSFSLSSSDSLKFLQGYGNRPNHQSGQVTPQQHSQPPHMVQSFAPEEPQKQQMQQRPSSSGHIFEVVDLGSHGTQQSSSFRPPSRAPLESVFNEHHDQSTLHPGFSVRNKGIRNEPRKFLGKKSDMEKRAHDKPSMKDDSRQTISTRPLAQNIGFSGIPYLNSKSLNRRPDHGHSVQQQHDIQNPYNQGQFQDRHITTQYGHPIFSIFEEGEDDDEDALSAFRIEMGNRYFIEK